MADRSHARLAALADELERTMRAIGVWSEPAPPLVPFSQPFAMDTMPFEHWLQLVLVPRMRAIAASGEPLPMRSNLAPHAVREYDGDEERMAPLFAVLRAIDDVCPPHRAPGKFQDPRRVTAGVMLVVLGLGWLPIAFQIGNVGARVATNLFPARVFQTWTGTVAPGPDFQPLRITVAAEVDDVGALNLRDGNLVLIRSMATMRNGPTAPLRFRATGPPAPTDVSAWLGNYGVPPGPLADDAIAEALAVLGAANTTTTRDALHGVQIDRPVQPQADALLEVQPQAPAWVEIAVTIVALLAGLVPILIGALRYGRALGQPLSDLRIHIVSPTQKPYIAESRWHGGRSSSISYSCSRAVGAVVEWEPAGSQDRIAVCPMHHASSSRDHYPRT